jgi:AraC-like DNA-binding protein
VAFLLFACAAGILFYGLILLLAGGNKPLRNLIAMNCLAASYSLVVLAAAATGMLLRLPFLANSDIAVKYPLVASFFVAARIILREGKSPARSLLAFLLPPALLAAGAATYSVLTAPAFFSAHGVLPGHYSNPIFWALNTSGDILWLLACILNLLYARRIFRAREVHDAAGFRHQLVFLTAYSIPALIALLADSLGSERLYNIACAILGVIWMCYALTRTTAFYFSRDLRAPRRQTRRPHWDSSAGDLDARLSSLMEKEALYRDETLSLRRLAVMMGVEPKRLSYHLNLHHSCSFRSYINELRLAAVGRELLADPRRSILDTAFANGFNSKSSFNALFRKRYGMGPREFRQAGVRRVEGGRFPGED